MTLSIITKYRKIDKIIAAGIAEIDKTHSIDGCWVKDYWERWHHVFKCNAGIYFNGEKHTPTPSETKE